MIRRGLAMAVALVMAPAAAGIANVAGIAGVAGLASAGIARAQGAPLVVIQGPPSNPVTDALGTFSVVAQNFPAADLPLQLQLQISETPDFAGALFADTTVAGPAAVITIPRLLPPGGVLYWRAFALTARAGSVPSATTGPATIGPILQLVSPNNPAGQSLNTRQPTFVWRSARVPAPFGVWTYELRIDETATGLPRTITTTTDTTVTLIDPLEANTSYRWRVKARLASVGDSLTRSSAGTFVVLSDEAPLATVLHNPFPSPFPFGGVRRMCVWFDLENAGPVSLAIVDVRGITVRRLVPSGELGTTFAAGIYGRPSPGATSGCDDRFSWDGTDASGRAVPPGVYLVHLRAAGRDFRRRVVFSGH